MKKRGLKLLLLAIVMTFSFGLSAIVGASADGEKSFAMVGASVRTNESSGLRFEATVDKATYESVINDPNKTFGAFILPKDYLEAAEITAITNHKAQFKAKNLEYLNREDITGVQIDNEANADYSLKYSIVELHYYNYNRTFVGLFFIKTGDGDAATYEYATVNGANNERSIAYVSNAAIEHDESVDETAYKFALKAAYLGVNGYVDTKTEEEQNTAADTFFTENKETAADLYAKVKAVAAISAINAWDIEQKAAITAYNEAYGAAGDVLKAWIAGISSYGACSANATEFAAKSATAVADLKASINKLPAESEITVLSKAKVAELKNILEIAKDDLGSEYATLSAKLNAAENAINQNYTALIDMSAPVFRGRTDALANVTEDTIMYNTNYTAPENLAETKTQQVDDVYGSYLGSKFKNQELGYLHICFYYKFSEAVKTSIQQSSFDKVCMFVYNGSASDKDVLNSFGDGQLHTEYSGVKFKAGEWTLLTVPKADFLNGYYYGIMGAQIQNTEYKFSTVFATNAEGLAKLNVYTSGIIDAINNLPDAPGTVDENTTIPEVVTAAMTAYEAFGASERAIIDANPAAHAKLEAWINVKQQVAVSYVVKAINNMEDYKSSTVPVVYSSAKYSAVAAEYEKLTKEQKALVTNYDKLKAWTDAANKAALVYKDGEYSIYSNTTTPYIFQITNIPEKIKDYGNISRVYCNGEAANVRLAFNNLPDLTDYDVVRFPIYLDSDEVGASTWPLVYKFKGQDDIAGGYRTLKAGWNIVTVPVSKVADGIEIGANMIAAKTNVYYAIPYAEKLESGDAIASYKYENDGIYIGGKNAYSDTYQAQVTVTSVKDNENGTVMNVKAEYGSVTNGFQNHFAFKVTNYSELKMVVAETGATSVKFKIKANKDIGRIIMSGVHSTGDIKLTGGEWKEIELTKAQFATWTGCFLDDWEVPAELQLTDFTIVK